MIKLGKRTLVRRRGKGGKQFRAVTVGKIAPAKYPNFRLDQNHSGIIVDIVHERGRNAPLARIHFDDELIHTFLQSKVLQLEVK